MDDFQRSQSQTVVDDSQRPPPFNPNLTDTGPHIYYPQPPPQPQPQQPVSQTQPLLAGSRPLPIATVIHWGDTPLRLSPCPCCGANAVTKVKHDSGSLAWLSAGGLCIIGCWLGCCLIPFCVDSLKDPVHTCSNCHNVVGRGRRI